MTIVIPASDTASTVLNGIVSQINAEITAAGPNGPLAHFHTIAKAQAQLNLVLHLLSSGKLTAASVLSNCTYGS